MLNYQFNLSATNTSQRMTGAHFPVNNIWFYGYRTASITGAPVNNTAPVYIGNNALNHPIIVPTGGVVNLNLGDKNKDSLNNFYMVGQQNDGAYIISY